MIGRIPIIGSGDFDVGGPPTGRVRNDVDAPFHTPQPLQELGSQPTIPLDFDHALGGIITGRITQGKPCSGQVRGATLVQVYGKQ